MNRYHMSLRRKVMLTLYLMAGIILLLSSLTSVVRDVALYRRTRMSNLYALGDVLATNLIPAMVFKEPLAASKVLASMHHLKIIDFACVFTPDGQQLASYACITEPRPPGPLPKVGVHVHSGGSMTLVHPIYSESGQFLGTLIIGTNPSILRDNLWATVLTQLIVFILLGGVAYAMAFQLQAIITRPVLELAQVTHRVTTTRDYSLRAKKLSFDEIGLLTDGFNKMLDHIQEAKATLEYQNDHLEALVDVRTAELIIARDRAEAASRAKSSFLANMSHEMRTPLTGILLYAQVIKDMAEATDQPKLGIDAGRIETSGQHLLTLISDILDLAKIEAGKMQLHLETIPTQTLIQEVIHSVEPVAAKRGNVIHYTISPNLPVLTIDVMRMRQVLINLLSNACKFTKSGTITVTVTKEIDERSKAPWLVIAVADTGIGISEDHLPLIFDEFTQGEDSRTKHYGGTGLGLTLTRKFCQMMDGDIFVRSTEGQGSAFTVQIPQPL